MVNGYTLTDGFRVNANIKRHEFSFHGLSRLYTLYEGVEHVSESLVQCRLALHTYVVEQFLEPTDVVFPININTSVVWILSRLVSHVTIVFYYFS